MPAPPTPIILRGCVGGWHVSFMGQWGDTYGSHRVPPRSTYTAPKLPSAGRSGWMTIWMWALDGQLVVGWSVWVLSAGGAFLDPMLNGPRSWKRAALGAYQQDFKCVIACNRRPTLLGKRSHSTHFSFHTGGHCSMILFTIVESFIQIFLIWGLCNWFWCQIS